MLIKCNTCGNKTFYHCVEKNASIEINYQSCLTCGSSFKNISYYCDIPIVLDSSGEANVNIDLSQKILPLQDKIVEIEKILHNKLLFHNSGGDRTDLYSIEIVRNCLIIFFNIIQNEKIKIEIIEELDNANDIRLTSNFLLGENKLIDSFYQINAKEKLNIFTPTIIDFQVKRLINKDKMDPTLLIEKEINDDKYKNCHMNFCFIEFLPFMSEENKNLKIKILDEEFNNNLQKTDKLNSIFFITNRYSYKSNIFITLKIL